MNNLYFLNIWGSIASFLTLICIYLTGDKNVKTWYISIITQCIWFYIGITTKQYYMPVAVILKQILNIRGLLKWKKDSLA